MPASASLVVPLRTSQCHGGAPCARPARGKPCLESEIDSFRAVRRAVCSHRPLAVDVHERRRPRLVLCLRIVVRYQLGILGCLLAGCALQPTTGPRSPASMEEVDAGAPIPSAKRLRAAATL